MAAADIRPVLVKLLDALLEVREKEDQILAEISTLLNDGEGVGAKLRRVKAAWCAIWSERHKEQCSFDHVKHTPWLKKKLAEYPEEQIIAKIQSYVTNDEAYYVRARHPFGMFMTNFNTWRGLPVDTAADDSAALKLRALRGE